MTNDQQLLWLNGVLQAGSAARIDPADRGFTLGDGVFETVAAIGGGPRALPQHLARLRQGAEVLGIAVPYADPVIVAGIHQLIEQMAGLDVALRLTLSRGPAPRGLLPPVQATPTLLITAGAMPPVPPPARAVIAQSTRRNQFSPLARIKSLNYLDNILARREAAERGADEAILLNTEARVVESSISNLFAVVRGALVTPPVAEGALPGIRRAQLLDLGLATEAILTPADLRAASEIILTNSLALRPVATLDEIEIGDGSPGPVFRALLERLG